MKRLAAAALAIVLAACTTGGSPTPSAVPPTATPTAKATPSATKAPTPAPTKAPTAAPTKASTPAPEPTDALGPFDCSYPRHIEGTVGRAHISDVRVGAHEDYDRIVFEFEKGIPTMDVRPGMPPFTYDPSGLPLEVAGNDFLIFILRGGTGITPEGRVTYAGPTVFTPRYPLLVEFVQAGDFEAQSEWVAGLTGPACMRVFTLTNPDRLVIDLAAE